MTKQKTPTLAQLRKLAKRKGYSVEWMWFRLALDPRATYPHGVLDIGVKENGGMTLLMQVYRNRKSEAWALAFAALSALPDKETR